MIYPKYLTLLLSVLAEYAAPHFIRLDLSKIYFQKAHEHIAHNNSNLMTVSEIADIAGIRRSHLRRILNNDTLFQQASILLISTSRRLESNYGQLISRSIPLSDCWF